MLLSIVNILLQEVLAGDLSLQLVLGRFYLHLLRLYQFAQFLGFTLEIIFCIRLKRA